MLSGTKVSGASWLRVLLASSAFFFAEGMLASPMLDVERWPKTQKAARRRLASRDQVSPERFGQDRLKPLMVGSDQKTLDGGMAYRRPVATPICGRANRMCITNGA